MYPDNDNVQTLTTAMTIASIDSSSFSLELMCY